MLKNKKIILGITGSISAYKTAFLTRILVKAGAEVRIIITDSAKTFITPLTLATLSKNPVLTDFQKNPEGEWNNHVELGLWADVFLIAPASANTLAKAAHGICDNLLMAVYLSARCPVFFAPAMDLDMFLHPSTAENLQKLQTFGNHIIEPETGELASGLHGKGRMAEPEHISQILTHFFENITPKITSNWTKKNILITAGATREMIDPVRFISNRSTGKTGYALAEEALRRGANVTLVSGKTNLEIRHPNLQKIEVLSAENMFEVVMQHTENQDIIIHSAAVADYTPKIVGDKKLKKADDDLKIELKRTKDIAHHVGNILKNNQLHIGFALETDNELENAQRKLIKKNFDMIVLNSLRDEGAGFEHDTNKITILTAEGKTEYPLQSKKMVAKLILDVAIHLYKNKGLNKV